MKTVEYSLLEISENKYCIRSHRVKLHGYIPLKGSGILPVVWAGAEPNLESRYFQGPRSSALVLRRAVAQRHEENHSRQGSVWPATDWIL